MKKLFAIVLFAMFIVFPEMKANALAEYEYDESGKLLSAITDKGAEAIFRYDANGNLQSRQQFNLNLGFEHGLDDWVLNSSSIGRVEVDATVYRSHSQSMKVAVVPALQTQSIVKDYGATITGRHFTVSAYVKHGK